MSDTEEEFDSLAFITKFDQDALGEQEIIVGFQNLIDSGIAWRIEGRYGRFAQQLINDGKCKAKKKDQPPSPAVGEVVISTEANHTIGPYERVKRDSVRLVHGDAYRLILYGAYNARGLVGAEHNGIAVLQESPPAVIADKVACDDTGTQTPTAAQIAQYEEMRTCDDEKFRAIVNATERLRKVI